VNVFRLDTRPRVDPLPPRPHYRQPILYQDLTQSTPADIDVWIAAAFQQG
jgi:hypothetical protein